MRIVFLIAITLLLAGCASPQRTGTAGATHLYCEKDDAVFQLDMPEGSGRELTEGLKTDPDHACGGFSTGPMMQGRESRVLEDIKDIVNRDGG